MRNRGRFVFGSVFAFWVLVFSFFVFDIYQVHAFENVLSPTIVNLLHDHDDEMTLTSPFFSSFISSEVFPTASLASVATGDYCLRVPIIMYHHVQPIEMARQLGHDQLTVDSYYFEQQMAYLVNEGYYTISSDELVEALLKRRGLPEKSVIITLDDGYDDMYAYVFPVLRKYRVVGNFMIPTGLIGTKGYLSWDELREMVKSPYVRIYNHTWSHAHLGSATLEEVRLEISRSQNQFVSNLGVVPNIISYPYGSFTDEVKNIVKDYGFIAGISTIGGVEQCLSRIMELPRVRAGNSLVPPLGY